MKRNFKTSLLFLITLFASGCASTKSELAVQEYENQVEIDRLICSKFPEQRPGCLFPQNDVARDKMYAALGMALTRDGHKVTIHKSKPPEAKLLASRRGARRR